MAQIEIKSLERHFSSDDEFISKLENDFDIGMETDEETNPTLIDLEEVKQWKRYQ